MSGLQEDSGVVRDEVESHLKAWMQRLGATSCTFYLRDPVWNDFRLLSMPGVQHPEPMHGWMLPAESKARISEGKDVEYFSSADNWQLRETLAPAIRELSLKNPIFGDFVLREGVKSCIRLIFRKPAGTLASLFINFRESQDFEADPTLPPQIEQLKSELTPRFPQLLNALSQEDYSSLGRLVEILKPTEELNALWRGPDNDPKRDILKVFFKLVLETALKAFDIQPDDGFGTIHRYRSDTGMLEPYGWTARGVRNLRPQLMRVGEGVISWVGLKRRAILIEDLENSQFREIHIPLRKGIRSELAVPMLARDELLGVLNLESTIEKAFSPRDLRALWYASNHAAIACQLSQQAAEQKELTARNTELLEICREASIGKLKRQNTGDGRSPLDRFARLLCQWGEAALCDIWRWDGAGGGFRDAGASDPGVDLTVEPRKNGWSAFIQKEGIPIWISDIRSLADFQASRWNETTGEWTSVREDPQAPTQISDRLSTLGVAWELGIPILVLDQCIGVAWLKYQSPSETRPSADLMRSARLLAGNMGLVMDFLQRYNEDVQRAEAGFRAEVQSFQNSLFPQSFSGLLPGLVISVKNRPKDLVGGDIYAFVRGDPSLNRVFGFLADSKGHGIAAALQAMPLLAIFRMFCKQTASTKYVLERLVEVADELGIVGTGVCFFIDLEAKDSEHRPIPLLSACSAGHPPLLIIKPSGAVSEFPDRNGLAQTVQFIGTGGKTYSKVFAEELRPLEYGDIIIACTDGIPETFDPNGNQFGQRGILVTALKHLDEHPDRIAVAIYEAARRHAGRDLEDDATVVVIKLLSPTAAHRDT